MSNSASKPGVCEGKYSTFKNFEDNSSLAWIEVKGVVEDDLFTTLAILYVVYLLSFW